MSARGRNSKPQPKGGRGRPAKNTAKGRGKGQGKGQPNRPRRGDGQRGTTPIRTPDEGRGGGHLGGDQVEGRHAVRELLMAGTRRTREVIFAGDLDPAPILDDIIDLADEQKVMIREISRSKFESMTRTDGAQGVLATAQPLRPTPIEDLLEPERDGTPPFLLLL
ncbi:MAG: RNA methyltransferase substrate-binding domain-containing protein, partial [Acidimicrobiales bacterium]